MLRAGELAKASFEFRVREPTLREHRLWRCSVCLAGQSAAEFRAQANLDEPENRNRVHYSALITQLKRDPKLIAKVTRSLRFTPFESERERSQASRGRDFLQWYGSRL